MQLNKTEKKYYVQLTKGSLLHQVLKKEHFTSEKMLTDHFVLFIYNCIDSEIGTVCSIE